ncbi:autotransporter family protein [Stieleria varia]|uniref:Extracellular serine protease n=1 Tax=Stieleria varia TaxID=2528005 RepID=A0A5C6ATC3_9BACT|nr:autotransporter outer membrane beta-barrel domain-containing protein [Stieleria varia]TWU02970.1 Extracellular serine protease precursor [Stieleria varia]
MHTTRPRNNPLRKRRGLLAFLGLAFVASAVSAADITVTTNADSGAGSLREALSTAASGDRIVFDIAGPSSTITLLSDLPTLTGDISFFNSNVAAVIIDRDGVAAPLTFNGGTVDPSGLNIVTTGAPSPDADIIASAGTTIFGEGQVDANMDIAGILAPGASAAAGTVGTMNVTGDLDLSGGELQSDISATSSMPTRDLVDVDGTVDVTGATLTPNFVGDQFEVTQQFVLVESTNPIVGTFANAADVYQLPNNPFLEAATDATMPATQFGLMIRDNGLSFAGFVDGCNQTAAAIALDDLRTVVGPDVVIADLRNGSAAQVTLAVDQLSGSIYASLLSAEINHIQTNLESVRDRVLLQADGQAGEPMLMPWVRGYGLVAHVDRDDCQTLGYRHEVGGLELGCGVSSGGGFSAHTFAHLSGGNLDARGVDQTADIESYRMGGSVEYIGQNLYALAAGGAGMQNYDVRRSLDAFTGSTFAESSFDGSTQFGYFETGTVMVGKGVAWNPYLGLHGTRVEIDPYAETGDMNFALSGGGGAGDSLRSVLGLGISQDGATALGPASTRIRLGWLHEYLDESETMFSQIASDPGTVGPLVDRGVTAGTDWAIVRVQADLGFLLGGQLTTAYQGQFNSNSAVNSFLAGVRWVY